MQAPPPPTDQAEAEAIIPMEIVSSIPDMTVREGPDENLNPTVAASRKAAKRTLPWDLTAEELLLLSSQPQQAEDIPAASQPPQAEEFPAARKKRRIEETLPTTTYEAARKTASPAVSVGLPPPPPPPPASDDDDDDTNADPVMDTQPNAAVTRATARWTSDEDAKLTRAITSTSKMKRGKKYKTDFAAVAALVLSRTQRQCRDRWKNVLDPNIASRASVHRRKWTTDEDNR
jgi:hypothetical protein